MTEASDMAEEPNMMTNREGKGKKIKNRRKMGIRNKPTQNPL
jgi:hypothetical protein